MAIASLPLQGGSLRKWASGPGESVSVKKPDPLQGV